MAVVSRQHSLRLSAFKCFSAVGMISVAFSVVFLIITSITLVDQPRAAAHDLGLFPSLSLQSNVEGPHTLKNSSFDSNYHAPGSVRADDSNMLTIDRNIRNRTNEKTRLPNTPWNQSLTRMSTDDIINKQKSFTEMDDPSLNNSTPVVAYAISITSCPNRPGGLGHERWFFDAILVLKRSIELASYPEHPTSRYGSKVYAIVNQKFAKSSCTEGLKRAGYDVLSFPVPLEPSDYSAEFLRTNVHKDGCCGHMENLKLRVYSLVQHPIALHLDIDSMILKPLDELFDTMSYPPHHPKGVEARLHLQLLVAPTYKPILPLSEMTINALFTKDYNMIKRSQLANAVGLQGGFILVRPDEQVFEHIISLQRNATYFGGRNAQGTGWYGSGYGSHIYGALTIQGFLSFYYTNIAKSTSVELHRCKFNQMADNPRRSSYRGSPRATPLNSEIAGYHDQGCKDGRNTCDDVQCQTWSVNDTRSVHFNFCSKPWACANNFEGITIHEETCNKLHREWFTVRRSLTPIDLAANGTYHPEVYLGFCNGAGPTGYIPLP